MPEPGFHTLQKSHWPQSSVVRQATHSPHVLLDLVFRSPYRSKVTIDSITVKSLLAKNLEDVEIK